MSTKTKKTIRDIKDRRFQFLAIIVVLSLGASMFYGLSMVTLWRQESLDHSYKEMQWEDIQIDLLRGTYVNNTVIQQAIEQIPNFSMISGIEYRLIMDNACNISIDDSYTIIPSKVIGINLSSDQSSSQNTNLTVNTPHVESGRFFSLNESNKSVAVVDKRLFEHHEINLGSNITIQTPVGGKDFEIIGTATFPEYIVLLDDNAMGLFAEKQYTVLEIPLVTLQNSFLLPEMINQVIIRTKDSLNIEMIKSEMETQLEDLDLEMTFTLGTEHPVYKMLYEDIENDNTLFMLIAALFLISGGFGSYVTINRLATSQKREIGISLAIGYSSMSIIKNYLLFPLIISCTSALGTLILGNYIANLYWEGIIDMLGFPYLLTNIQFRPLIEALFLVIIIPIFATILVVWRFTRNSPVSLIRFDPRTSHATTQRSFIEKTLLRFFKIPISFKISLRNIFRHRRRTISTLSGVIMSICLMGVIWGLLDSFDAGLVSAENDIGDWSARFETTGYSPENLWSNQISSLVSSDSVSDYQLGLQIPIKFTDINSDNTDELINFMEGLTADTDIRKISLIKGNFEKDGIVLSQPTAAKLNINIGENTTIQHVFLKGSSGYIVKNSSVKITGIHNQIFGSYCFMPIKSVQNLCNASNLVNSGYVVYQDSVEEEVIKDLYNNLQGVTKVISRNSLIEETKEIFDLFYNITMVAQSMCMILALALIYNSVYSNIHERKREIGTMRTLGTPKRDILRSLLIENGIMVFFGIIIGISLGYLLVDSLLQEVINETFPHLFVPTEISITSWSVISGSVVFVLLLAHISVIFFLRNLDLVGATKVRE